VTDKALRVDPASGRHRAVDLPYAYQTATPLAGKELVMSAATVTGGLVTFTLPAYFTTVHGVWAQAVRNSSAPADGCFAQVKSFSNTQVVVQVFESKNTGVLLLNTNVEGLEASSSGITVTLLVKGI
jgi:hypothetical protein